MGLSRIRMKACRISLWNDAGDDAPFPEVSKQCGSERNGTYLRQSSSIFVIQCPPASHDPGRSACYRSTPLPSAQESPVFSGISGGQFVQAGQSIFTEPDLR